MTLKSLLAGAAFVALSTSGAAWAQECCSTNGGSSPNGDGQPDIINEQIQLGDVFADMNVVVPGQTDGDVSATGLAYGNTVSVDSAVGGWASSDQTMMGEAAARAEISGGDIAGTATASSIAYGNSGMFIVSDGDSVGDPLDQLMGGPNVSAQTIVNVGTTGAISAASVATANTLGVEVSNGDTTSNVDQQSAANVIAETDVDACCTSDGTLASATAIANSYSSDTTTSTVRAAVTQTATGPASTAIVDVYQAGGSDITAASSASGNSIVIDNEWGYAQLDGSQDNQSVAASETYVTLDDWAGTASASSYGVGNSVLIYNVGSDANGFYTQSNTGDVFASTEFDGTSSNGGVAMTSATAIGNAYTTSVCTGCGAGTAGGSIAQYNGATVSASNYGTATGAGGYYGSAAAIGNSASFVTTQASTD